MDVFLYTCIALGVIKGTNDLIKVFEANKITIEYEGKDYEGW